MLEARRKLGVWKNLENTVSGGVKTFEEGRGRLCEKSTPCISCFLRDTSILAISAIVEKTGKKNKKSKREQQNLGDEYLQLTISDY